MYIAIHYIKINGTVYTPGEVITEDIAAEEVARLNELGAIRTSGAPFLAPAAQAEESAGDPDKSGDKGSDGAEDAPDTPDEEEAAEEDAGDDDSEDYEDAEAPEIDVADSISAPDAEPEPEEKKPAQKRRGRKE